MIKINYFILVIVISENIYGLIGDIVEQGVMEMKYSFIRVFIYLILYISYQVFLSGQSTRALRNVEYSFTYMTQNSTLTRSGSTC